MPVRRVERTKDKISRAYWLQPFLENGQFLFPASHLREDPEVWRALEAELILFPSAEHDDLVDALQTAAETATEEPGELVAYWLDAGPYSKTSDWPPRSRTWRIPWYR